MALERSIDLQLVKGTKPGTKGRIPLKTLLKDLFRQLDVSYNDDCCDNDSNAGACPAISAEDGNIIECLPDGLYAVAAGAEALNGVSLDGDGAVVLGGDVDEGSDITSSRQINLNDNGISFVRSNATRSEEYVLIGSNNIQIYQDNSNADFSALTASNKNAGDGASVSVTLAAAAIDAFGEIPSIKLRAYGAFHATKPKATEILSIGGGLRFIHTTTDAANRYISFSIDGGTTERARVYAGGIMLSALVNAANPRLRFDLTDDPLHSQQAEIGFEDPVSLTARYMYIQAGNFYTIAEKPNNDVGLHIQFHTGFGGTNRSAIWRNGNFGIGFNASGPGLYQVKYKLGVNGKVAINNIPEYVDNAAALAGLEEVGALYRTTGTGDVKVVI